MLLYIETILVYTLLTLLMCYCAYRSQLSIKKSQLWSALPIVLFTLVFGLRYGVGIDYNNYLDIYNETKGYTSLASLLDNERYEIGFSLLVYICHLLHAPVWVLFTVISFVQILLLYKTFQKEGNVLIFIYATLILTGFCMHSLMNILRHEMAFCIFLYSLKYIQNRQFFKYLICCLFALSFHRSALLIIPLYFIWARHHEIFHRKWIELIIVLACFISSFLTQWQNILHLFDNVIILLGYENYIEIADSMTVNSKIGITRILNLLINCLIIINSQKIKDYYKSNLFNILYDLFIIGISLGYVFLGSMMLQRIIVYFYHTQFFILFLHDTKKRPQNICPVLSICFVYSFIIRKFHIQLQKEYRSICFIFSNRYAQDKRSLASRNVV